MMTSNQIKDLIAQELKVEQDLTNVSGLDLTKCLISPVQQTYVLSNEEKIELWTVLKESPSTEDGYCVFYDPEENEFGLGMISNSGIHNIGYYGTFLETIYAM